MNTKELCKKIAAVEGKKQNLSIAQITEVVNIVSDMVASDDADPREEDVGYQKDETYACLLKNGKRRRTKK